MTLEYVLGIVFFLLFVWEGQGLVGWAADMYGALRLVLLVVMGVLFVGRWIYQFTKNKREALIAFVYAIIVYVNIGIVSVVLPALSAGVRLGVIIISAVVSLIAGVFIHARSRFL